MVLIHMLSDSDAGEKLVRKKLTTLFWSVEQKNGLVQS